jgi:hypothetical protein
MPPNVVSDGIVRGVGGKGKEGKKEGSRKKKHGSEHPPLRVVAGAEQGIFDVGAEDAQGFLMKV